MSLQLSRREILVAGAAAAVAQLPDAGISSLAAAAAVTQSPTVGVSTLGFGDYTNEELAKELAKNNIHTIQLFLSQKDSNYWVYNGRND
ncbi:MAG: hypothetical protein KAH38_06755, partial [Candidatus Hydrogenedentes bacterium]|nr:hypothetical protein [Candidatus Hydrogenedentota bacterium]